MTKQVKSRERVSEHGEVFTNEREVNAMLDLVKHETERIDSRFLDIKTLRLIQFNYLQRQDRGGVSLRAREGKF